MGFIGNVRKWIGVVFWEEEKMDIIVFLAVALVGLIFGLMSMVSISARKK